MIVFECDVCGSTFKDNKDARPNSIIIESCTYKGNAINFNVPSITKGETFGLKRDLCPRCMSAILQFLYPKNEEGTKSCENCIHETVCMTYLNASKAFDIIDPERTANNCKGYIPNLKKKIKENNNG